VKTPPDPQKYCDICQGAKKSVPAEFVIVNTIDKKNQYFCKKHAASKVAFLSNNSIKFEISERAEQQLFGKKTFIFR
jgi:hypothetical protein